MLLCELYNFQVVGSTLLFDYIRLFLSSLTELHAELLPNARLQDNMAHSPELKR